MLISHKKESVGEDGTDVVQTTKALVSHERALSAKRRWAFALARYWSLRKISR